MKDDIEMTVACIGCKATRVLKASEGPHNDVPLCDKCGLPMMPKTVVAKKGGKIVAKGNRNGSLEIR